VKKQEYRVAVVGATGAVGEQIRGVLEQRLFPIKELRLLASKRSAEQILQFRGKGIRVEELHEESFQNDDLVLFSDGGAIGGRYDPTLAVSANILWVDLRDHQGNIRFHTEVGGIVNYDGTRLYRQGSKFGTDLSTS